MNARFISLINHRPTTFQRLSLPQEPSRCWCRFRELETRSQPIRSRIVSGANKLCTTFFFIFIYSIYNCIVTSLQLIGMAASSVSPREYWFAPENCVICQFGDGRPPLWQRHVHRPAIMARGRKLSVWRQTVYFKLHPLRFPAG